MTETAANVVNGTTGAIYVAPTGTDLPTSAATALASLDAAFNELGYISEDGVTQTIGSDTTQLKAWQNGDVINEVETSHVVQYKFGMLEINPDTLELYYGNYDGSGSEGVVEIKGGQVTRGPLVLIVEDGDNMLVIVAPDAKVVAREDVSYKNGEPIILGVTLTCFPDTNGVKAYKYVVTVGAS